MSSLGVRTFGVSFAAREDIDALPVVLTDHSLSAPAAELLLGFEDFEDSGGIFEHPTRDDALVVGWPSGICDDRADISIEENGFSFLIRNWGRDGVCEPLEATRTVIVTYSRPVQPRDVSLTFFQCMIGRSDCQ